MRRHGWVVALLAAVLPGPAGPAGAAGEDPAPAKRRFVLATATAADIQAAIDAGALDAERLVRLYLARIEAYDARGPEIRSVLHLNQGAVAEARALDAERRAKGRRSPIHGLPVVLKGVFDVEGLPTTGGGLPKGGVPPTRDSAVARRLRAAGAVMLAKVNASAFGDLRTKNPHDLGRMPGFSSSGTAAAMAAWFSALGIGSETGFSIRTPSSDCNLFGFSTTPGLVSRDGQMVSWLTGERGGPMARNVHDLVLTLDAIAGFDPNDLWTAQSLGNMPSAPYASFLRKDGLRGARIGVLKDPWAYVPSTPEGHALAAEAVAALAANGATLVHGLSIGVDLEATLTSKSFPSRFERLAALERYLARQGPGYPFHSAAELAVANPAGSGRRGGLAALVADPPDLDHDPEYHALLANREALRRAVTDLMDRFRLDALVFPHKLFPPVEVRPEEDVEREGNQLSSLGGLPSFAVPMGFGKDGLPYGMEFLGRPWSEPVLIRLASGFEAVTANRRIPASTPALAGEEFEY